MSDLSHPEGRGSVARLAGIPRKPRGRSSGAGGTQGYSGGVGEDGG